MTYKIVTAQVSRRQRRGLRVCRYRLFVHSAVHSKECGPTQTVEEAEEEIESRRDREIEAQCRAYSHL